jgi:hypothetical protein
MTYVSTTEVKYHSKVAYDDLGFASDGAFDTWLATVIPLIEAQAEAYCNLPVNVSYFSGGVGYSGSTAKYYDYRDMGRILLRHYPILTVYKIEYNSQGYGIAEIWEEVSSVDYRINKENGVVYLTANVPATVEQGLRLSYKTGFSSVPNDFKIAVLTMVSNYLQVTVQRKTNPIVRVDDFTVKVPQPEILTREVKAILDNYRKGEGEVG